MSTHDNEAMVALVAERLGPIAREVVFVGGATISLLLTDPAAPLEDRRHLGRSHAAD